MRYEHHGEHEYPIRKDWRYSPGELIRISRSHYGWKGEEEMRSRVEEGECVIFLQAYGFSYYGTNWKRNEWNIKVLSPTLGIIWISDEYTEHVENVYLETVEIGLEP